MSHIDILNIGDHVVIENSKSYCKTISHPPYANTTLNKCDKIRIPIQSQDLFTLTFQSYFERLMYLKATCTSVYLLPLLLMIVCLTFNNSFVHFLIVNLGENVVSPKPNLILVFIAPATTKAASFSEKAIFLNKIVS